jgi:hypothetical protein
VFLVLAHGRRRIRHLGVTALFTALFDCGVDRSATTRGFPVGDGAALSARDRDRIFGADVVRVRIWKGCFDSGEWLYRVSESLKPDPLGTVSRLPFQ